MIKTIEELKKLNDDLLEAELQGIDKLEHFDKLLRGFSSEFPKMVEKQIELKKEIKKFETKATVALAVVGTIAIAATIGIGILINK